MYLFLIIIICIIGISIQEIIKVTVFYESLCPGSQQFINNQLYPAYQKLGDEALSLELFPFSEVKKSTESDWYIYCQHGDKECFLNKVQVCALNLNSTQQNSINFIGCITSTDQPARKVNIRKCARKSKVSWTDIKACLNSDQGIELMAGIYNITMKLKPKLKYVPHIIFNDIFSRSVEKSARKDFLSTICQMYEVEKPAGCLPDTLN